MDKSTLIEQYCSQNSLAEPKYLQELTRNTWLNTINPRMLTGHLQGRLLAMLSKLVKPDLVVEIGTFTGYGALCLAEGLNKNGLVKTIEINTEYAYKAKEFINDTPMAHCIEVINQDGLEFLNALEESADIIYVDGEKRSYPLYIAAGEKALKKGGLLIFDNTLWAGKVLDAQPDLDTEKMQVFNKELNAQTGLEVLMLPIRDGISIAQKK